MSTTSRVCDNCSTAHAPDMARAVGRFAEGPNLYRAAYDGAPRRFTRALAMLDECERRRAALAARRGASC